MGSIIPTLSRDSSYSDGYIYEWDYNYDTARTSSTGIVSDSGNHIRLGQYKNKLGAYYIYRGFLFFNTSSIPSNMVVTNATLSLYYYSDYSSTDFDVVVHNWVIPELERKTDLESRCNFIKNVR